MQDKQTLAKLDRLLQEQTHLYEEIQAELEQLNTTTTNYATLKAFY